MIIITLENFGKQILKRKVEARVVRIMMVVRRTTFAFSNSNCERWKVFWFWVFDENCILFEVKLIFVNWIYKMTTLNIVEVLIQSCKKQAIERSKETMKKRHKLNSKYTFGVRTVLRKNLGKTWKLNPKLITK